jgi:hypothetical protein
MSSKSQFYREHYKIAREIGLSDDAARLATVQAALESNYGRSVRGNNYFGMKAGRSWKGPTRLVNTHEEIDGRLEPKKLLFRAYGSPEESYRDWQRVVARKWPDALTASNFEDAVAALRTGQQGGYATLSTYPDVARGRNRELDRSHARDFYERELLGNSLASQGLRDLSGRTGAETRSPHIDDWPDVSEPAQRSTARGDRLHGSIPIEERWSASATPTITDDEQRGMDQYRQRLAYEHAMAPRAVEAQPIRQAPEGRLPLAPSGYSAHILPSPQDEYGYGRYPAMSPASLPRSAPGGLMLSGGLLGGSSGGPGALVSDDNVAPRTERKPARKPGKRKLRLPGAGLY